MTTTFHPPVAGSANTPIKFITGYTNRNRNSVGQNLQRLLTRFFEFALALGNNNGSFNTAEPARSALFDSTAEIQFVFYGNHVPRDPSTVLNSLQTLLGSCPYFIWSDPNEASRSGVPNIMFSPGLTAYLSQISVDTFLTGLVIKGMYMVRQSELYTHAYPFKVYMNYFQDGQSPIYSYQIAYDGHLEKFYARVLEFYRLRLKMSSAIESVTLEYLHRDTAVYLTRGRKLIGQVFPEISLNPGATDTAGALSIMRNFPYITREAIKYAMDTLPDNQFSIMYKSTMRNPNSASYNFPSADMTLGYDASQADKEKYILSTFQNFLHSHSVPPPTTSGLGEKWGLSYVERLVAIDSTFDIVEEKIRNAIGASYAELVPEDKKMQIIPDYLRKLRVERKNILYLSETALEKDFREFLAPSLR